MVTAGSNDFEHVVGRPRQHDADRNLPVVGRVGRVERAGAGTEVDVSGDALP
jgi:hypothetical protein